MDLKKSFKPFELLSKTFQKQVRIWGETVSELRDFILDPF